MEHSCERRSSTTRLLGVVCSLGLTVGLQIGDLHAAISQTPLSVTQAVRPLVMFAMSNDHQLYKKAYDDYSDLGGDGELDVTYNNGYEYYGYFDPDKCYTHASGRFSPQGDATSHQCGGQWSGNFLNWAAMTRMDVLRKVLYGGYRSTDSTTQTILERVLLPTDVHAFAKVFQPPGGSAEVALYTPYAAQPAITLCNVTYASSGESQSLNAPPLIRVASGNWPSWASGEVVQCAWREERNNGTAPRSSDDELNELEARVEVCVAGLEEEDCKRYPQAGSAPKPTGLLQEHGEDGSLRFGLVTGSYNKNKSGGVLRRNISEIAGNADAALDEIDLQTGQFTGNPGIISTINSLRLNRYSYSSRNYVDGCNSPGILSFNNGSCTNWGNPISEIYLEALRYFAGKTSPTGGFSTDDSGSFSDLAPVTWTDPMPDSEWCAQCSMVVLSTGVNSFDRDQLSSDIAGLNAAVQTDLVGAAEGIAGDYLLGGANGKCDTETIAGLSDAQGVCPGGPSLAGGWDIAGLSYYAQVNDLRDDRDHDQTVDTFAVALARDLPRFQIPIGADTITLLPHCEANSSGTATQPSNGWRTCSLTDVKVESLQKDVDGNLIGGNILASWEDSTWGNDYDMDGISRISFCVGPTACADASVAAGELRVTTSAIQAYAGHALLFGFTVTGTDSGSTPANTDCDGAYHGDGAYREIVRRGGSNFSVFTGDNLGNRPDDCVRTFQAGTSAAGLLESPLWYAAKYGDFLDTNGNDLPDLQLEWDADTDGLPDNFFFADDPSELGTSLGRFLDIIAITSSSASVVANAVTLQTGTSIYQARFYSGDWSGDLLAIPLNGDGTVGSPAWNAKDRLNLQKPGTGREILTSTGPSGGGVKFRWSALTAAQKTALKTDPDTGTVGVTDDGKHRLSFLRGNQKDELQQGGTFRDRTYVLGDIVNSEPIHVGAPPFPYPNGFEGSNYSTFETDNAARREMLYVGANDGMLHGFDAATGDEVIAYIPRAVFGKLAALTSLSFLDSHQFYVDGGPAVGDAYLSDWRTVLVSGLGAGGKGVFALDITDPTDANFDEVNAASLVLWDITGADAGFSDLGYTYSKPAIIRQRDDTNSGKWAATFGNGYGSLNGKALLFVLDLSDGSILDSIEVHAGPGNGLSSVAPVDIDGDFKADYIYAGDLLGNLWRFEPDGAGSWTTSFSGSPLFVARDPSDSVQPITARPEVGLHPEGGVLVYFGTGKYFEIGDNAPNTTLTNSFYGVWDRLDNTAGIRRGHLLEQEILVETTSQGYELRVTSDHQATWHTGAGKPAGTPPTTHLGWYMDLLDPVGPTLEGEIQVTDSVLRAGRIIFTTMIPSEWPCDYGGAGWLMELEAIGGGRPEQPVFDLNGDKVFDVSDMVDVTLDGDDETLPPTGKKSKVGIIQKPAIVAAGSVEYKYASGSHQAEIELTTENPGGAAGGRQSWIELR